MTKRLIAAALAFTFGFSGLAQAQLDTTSPEGGPQGAQAAQGAQTVQAAQPARPAGYQAAKYSGGEGSTWKTGPNSHGFTGTYGGCRYTGFAGPNGYKIDRVC